MIRDYLERHPEDEVVPASTVLPAEVVDGEFLRTDPSAGPWDGAFAAAIRPRKSALRIAP